MKIQFVGAGSAFNKDDGQSNILVIANSGKKLLIDCGTYCWQFAKMIDIGYKDIDALYVSHLHADHVGGIEEMAFCTYFGKLPRPKLFCNRKLMHELWDETLRGGLESIQGKIVTLTEYFDCQPVDNNGLFTWEGIDFTPVQTVHVMAGYMIKYSYGLLIQQQSTKTRKVEEGYDALGNGCISSYRTVNVPIEEPVVFVGTDSQFCPNQIHDFYDRAHIIIQDCETSPYKSGVHAHYDELKTLPNSTRAKMWLCHYQPKPPQKPADDGFLGFVTRGQIIDVVGDADAKG